MKVCEWYSERRVPKYVKNISRSHIKIIPEAPSEALIKR
jgi:hypothetical protein